MWLIDFFRADFSKILGVCFDDDKIFLAFNADQFDFAEIYFEPSADVPAAEQLAEKIAAACKKRGWQNPKIALALREGTAATFSSEFKNIPANEINDAVKIWALAHVGKDARFTSIRLDDEIWMEALPAAIVDEYAAAFDKFSLELCALTEIPATSPRKLTPFNRAQAAAEIVINNAAPNILAEKIVRWNFKKIALTAAAVFLIALASVSAKLAHEYFTAAENLAAAQQILAAKSELAALKENYDADVTEMRRLNDLCAAKNSAPEKFNALIFIGQIADGTIWLDKIKASGETLELAGSADSPDAVKIYLRRLKNFAPNVKLENSAANDGQIDFSIRLTF